MKTVIIIVGILAAIAAGVLSFYGLFAPVNIQEKEIGPFDFVMESHVGAYKDVGPLIDKMQKDLNDDGIQTSMGVGIYYDDPKVTAEDKTRSIIGRIIEDADRSKVMEIERKYKVGELPQTNYLVVEFPFKGLPSIVIGIYRVYPKIARYMKTHEIPQIPVIEIYAPKAQKMFYIVPTSLNRHFFDDLMNKVGPQG
ncbi:MAG TPA: GyrI-like domain-containing protein [Desulfomonilia bacterium]